MSTGKFDHTMRRFFGTELCEACFEPEDSGIKSDFGGGYCGDSGIRMKVFKYWFSLIELMSCEFSW